jgi:hypothetical protein
MRESNIGLPYKYVGRISRCNQCPFRMMEGTVPGPPMHYSCYYGDIDRTIKNPDQLPKWCPLPNEGK